MKFLLATNINYGFIESSNLTKPPKGWLTTPVTTKDPIFSIVPSTFLMKDHTFYFCQVTPHGSWRLMGDLITDPTGAYWEYLKREVLIMYDTFDEYEMMNGDKAIVPTNSIEGDFTNVLSPNITYDFKRRAATFKSFPA